MKTSSIMCLLTVCGLAAWLGVVAQRNAPQAYDYADVEKVNALADKDVAQHVTPASLAKAAKHWHRPAAKPITDPREREKAANRSGKHKDWDALFAAKATQEVFLADADGKVAP